MLALFAAGIGSSGVDNWGHAGGLLSGAAMGCFMTPRTWPGDASARRLATAIGAVVGTLALGIVARPMLPMLGSQREGPGEVRVRVPLGWRRAAADKADRVSYTNGLTGAFRSSATVVQGEPCRGRACSCERLVRALIEQDLWRTADLGPLRKLELGEASVVSSGERVDGVLFSAEGRAQVGAVCAARGGGHVAIVVLQPPDGSATLPARMALSLR
jgi:hypothetical protein